MRRVLRLSMFLMAVPLLGIVGLSGWLAFIRPELLPILSAYAVKTVCSNVFIAKRDADAVIRTDVQIEEQRFAKRMKIDIDTANQRVEAAAYGLFARRYAQYAEGRGCTLIEKTKYWQAISWIAPRRRPCRRRRRKTRFGQPAKRRNCPTAVACGRP